MKKEKGDVLIVDDDHNIGNLIKDYCQDLGLFKNIVKVTDGLSASKQLQSQVFSLIILDLHLPKKNGTTILNEFHLFPLNKIENVLIVSGGLDHNLMGHIKEKGVKEFLSKPFTEADFKKIITDKI